MSKKRKMTGPAVAAKKQRNGGGARNNRVKPEKELNENAFETLWTRRKFHVLGKKQTKGEKKRVGQSRSLAVGKREKTLLQQYRQQGKGNKYVDRRFGEKDGDLSDGDKAILRFQKERQSQVTRKSKFTLPDNEEGETLTHRGMALSNVDDPNDNDSIEDLDDISDLDDDAVRQLNFGGGFSAKTEENVTTQGAKSKKEIMEDIIAKSKFYKAKKAKEKEEDEELKEKLDNDFSELSKSKAVLPLRPTRKDHLRSLPSKSSSNSEDPSLNDQNNSDEFDKLIKDMIFDIRGHAGDRLKTAEEIAQEERERLENLQKKSKKRMLDIPDSDDESDESEGNDGEPSKRRQRKEKNLGLSGDDLGENFFLEEDEQDAKGWVDEVLARGRDDEADSGEDGNEESDGDSEDDVEEKDANEETDDSASSGGFDELSSDEDNVPVKQFIHKQFPRKEESSMEHEYRVDKEKRNPVMAKERGAKKTSSEVEEVHLLPFVMNAPQTLGEFRALVDHRSVEDLGVAIQRIRSCTAISLAAENRKKMQIFYNVLLQYFGSLAMQKPCSFSTVNLITKPLIELSSETPYFAAHCARQRLIHMRSQLTENLKNNPDGSSCWPSLRTLLLLRFWSVIFPPSDFRHPVMTPATLLMAEYLMRCRVTSARDILVGSFLCNLFSSVLREAKRYCPEVLNFILALLISALSTDASRSNARSLCPSFTVKLLGSYPWLKLKGNEVGKLVSFDLDFYTLMTSENSAPVFDSDIFRCGILQSLLQTLNSLVPLYGDLVSFPEIFSPLLAVLRTMGNELVLPEKLERLRSDAAESIQTKLIHSENARQPLRMRTKKPTPIKQFNPKFEDSFVQGQNYDPDRGRADKKTLQKRIKSEAKGAARELRKDNYFLLEEKRREKAIYEEERKEKYGQAMQFLQEQESAFKSGQLGKGKGRKKRK